MNIPGFVFSMVSHGNEVKAQHTRVPLAWK
jgi:hypothetical protein